MAKRGASIESDEVMTKCSKSYTSLDDVSCGFSGLFSLTDPVRIEAVHWRDNGCFWGLCPVSAKSRHEVLTSSRQWLQSVLSSASFDQTRRCVVMDNCV